MRDHPWHTTKILGGMWGCRKWALSEEIQEKMMSYEKRGDYWQTDQNFLSDVVYDHIKDDVLVHDDGFFEYGATLKAILNGNPLSLVL